MELMKAQKFGTNIDDQKIIDKVDNKIKKLRFYSPEKIYEEDPDANSREAVTPLMLWLKKQL